MGSIRVGSKIVTITTIGISFVHQNPDVRLCTMEKPEFLNKYVVFSCAEVFILLSICIIFAYSEKTSYKQIFGDGRLFEAARAHGWQRN